MEIAIGNKIKQFRKMYNRTQDNMAQALGVTSQAISRWENGTGYPDIEIIPSIANYFGVTIDVLFGYDGSRNDKIMKILEHINEMEEAETEPYECLDYMRLASAEFPASDIITLRLANALMRCGWAYYGAVSLTEETRNEDGSITFKSHPDYEHNRGNKYWQEALVLYEKLIENTNDADIREYAVEQAVNIYWEFGDTIPLMELAGKAPHIRTSREMLMAKVETSNNRGNALMAVLESLTTLVLNAVRKVSNQQHIEECKMILSLYNFIFDDGNFGKYHLEMCDLYSRLTYHYWHDRMEDLAFEALAEAKKHYDRFYELLHTGEFRYSSTYTAAIVSDTSEWIPKYGMSDNSPKQFENIGWFDDEFCPGIREDARYHEITG